MNAPERSRSLFRFAAPHNFYPLAGRLAPWFAAARSAAPGVSFTIDGVHLSQAGAEVVADAFAAAVEAYRPPAPPS